MSRFRNMIAWFMKTYLYKPINILQFFSRGKIQKCLTSFRNILAFSVISHLQAESRIFLHVIPAGIIVPWWNGKNSHFMLTIEVQRIGNGGMKALQKWHSCTPSHLATICHYFLLPPSLHVTAQKVIKVPKIHFGTYIMLHIVNIIISRWLKRWIIKILEF